MTAQRRELHLPRLEKDPFVDEALLKRAQRLTKIAASLDGVDTRGMAVEYQRESGCSDAVASSLARSALGAALVAKVGGAGPGTDAGEAAKQEVHRLGTRRSRQVHGQEWHSDRLAKEGPAGEGTRIETRAQLNMKLHIVSEGRRIRVEEDIAERRMAREDRHAHTNARRELHEGKAYIAGGAALRCNKHTRKNGGGPHGTIKLSAADLQATGPALQRARELCTSASHYVSQIDERDRVLRGKGLSPMSPMSPSPPPRSSASLAVRATSPKGV
eukprot:NODE_12540_length_1219_cov_2.440476.p1 GENE.NODE_12540_length_1219_cov_2.440476~~NODE_12540_length_1219_cov_2.440476.p1  ORF type:complete len:273 (-),score=79.64 NODE_12540_length_1219_cov_2.440476:384-1202(-)